MSTADECRDAAVAGFVGAGVARWTCWPRCGSATSRRRSRCWWTCSSSRWTATSTTYQDEGRRLPEHEHGVVRRRPRSRRCSSRLAQQRGCHLELLLRHPGKPVDKELRHQEDHEAAPGREAPGAAQEDQPSTRRGEQEPSARSPTEHRPDAEDRDGQGAGWRRRTSPPGTEITKELIEKQARGDGDAQGSTRRARTATSADLHQAEPALKNGLAKGQWVTESTIGRPAGPKASPQRRPVKPARRAAADDEAGPKAGSRRRKAPRHRRSTRPAGR